MHITYFYVIIRRLDIVRVNIVLCAHKTSCSTVHSREIVIYVHNKAMFDCIQSNMAVLCAHKTMPRLHTPNVSCILHIHIYALDCRQSRAVFCYRCKL